MRTNIYKQLSILILLLTNQISYTMFCPDCKKLCKRRTYTDIESQVTYTESRCKCLVDRLCCHPIETAEDTCGCFVSCLQDANDYPENCIVRPIEDRCPGATKVCCIGTIVTTGSILAGAIIGLLAFAVSTSG